MVCGRQAPLAKERIETRVCGNERRPDGRRQAPLAKERIETGEVVALV